LAGQRAQHAATQDPGGQKLAAGMRKDERVVPGVFVCGQPRQGLHLRAGVI
jgi:hypothetical protein